MNRTLIFSLIFLVIIGIVVSRVKYEVVFLRKTYNSLEKDIERYNDDIKVLRAEWSSLNDPVRLKNLCEKYLNGMKPMENSQIMSYDNVMGNEYESNHRSSDAFDSFIDEALKTEG